jgi:hypothetical protein
MAEILNKGIKQLIMLKLLLKLILKKTQSYIILMGKGKLGQKALLLVKQWIAQEWVQIGELPEENLTQLEQLKPGRRH